jgi:hypothetical protein
MENRIAILAAILTLGAHPALAFSCAGEGIGGCHLPTADAIFVGTVLSKVSANTPPVGDPPAPATAAGGRQTRMPVSSDRPATGPNLTVTFRVSETLRGALESEVAVKTYAMSSAEYPFEIGHEYLVFADQFQGSLTTTNCTSTQPAKTGAALIRQLRAIRDGNWVADLFGFAGTQSPDTSIRGYEDVQPVPFATVVAKSQNAEYRTQTAADGSYEFRGLPAAGYTVNLEPPPMRVSLGNAPGHLAMSGATCPVNFRIYYDGRITGTVTDRNGQPQSGFIVALLESPGKLGAAPIAGEVKNGRFEILRLWPGRYRLVFNASVNGRFQVTPRYFYPGTKVEGEATLIEVGESAHVEGLLFTIF